MSLAGKMKLKWIIQWCWNTPSVSLLPQPMLLTWNLSTLNAFSQDKIYYIPLFSLPHHQYSHFIEFSCHLLGSFSHLAWESTTLQITGHPLVFQRVSQQSRKRKWYFPNKIFCFQTFWQCPMAKCDRIYIISFWLTISG